ncbi:TonB-linked SusC/RagA family outer membrane protein [Pedobacter nutrimenti]|uniref:TonB-linked SusC/RagA family outer membrane protein n=2 Tax=Pedobacter nutrimenti TaxID=1241337 RepID=A0A318UKG6_9SPHI|nr:TonB-linked SusC/RagA family outer membrane protein [Pedobacter nutrimenti]
MLNNVKIYLHKSETTNILDHYYSPKFLKFMKKLLQSLFVFMLFAASAIAQQRTITGTVTGKEDGLPLPGVSVRVKGAAGATQTGSDGKFTIKVAASARALEFTYIGYLSSSVEISGNVVNVSLTSDSKSLEELVITGYGSTTKVRATGSTVTVGAKDLEQTPFTSVDKALQGRVAGLQSVGASGQPGALQSIRIRGLGSISGSSDPLYVIDGIPVNSGDLSNNTTTSNALAGLNPNDVENMTVLKDAASTAIYGSRGANGVILITTKSGKAGKTKIRVDAEYGFVKPGTFNGNTRPLTTDENITLIGEGLLNRPDLVAAYGLTPANIRAFVVSPDGVGINEGTNTDWYKAVTRTGKQQSYNLAFDGGDAKTQFHVGGGYFSQDATVQRSKFDRVSGNVNLKHKFNEKLSFGTNIILSSSNTKSLLNGGAFGNPVLSALFIMPDLRATNDDGTPNISGALAPGAGLFNPLAILQNDNGNNNTQKAITSVYGEYKILPNLKISTKYGIDYNNIEEDSYNSPTYGDGRNVGGRTYRNYTRYFNWVWTNLVDYHIDIDANNNWVANIKAGYEAQKSNYYSIGLAAYNVPLNTNYQVPSVGATPISTTGTNQVYTFASLLALGDISYKNKYVLSASFRRDGSSRFGVNNQYGDFWSVGGTWNAEQEDFIKQYQWISQLKLRASYGLTGNAGTGYNSWRTLYGLTRTGYNFVYNGAIGSGPTQYGNPNLTWEKTKSFDVGFDLGLFNNRLTANFDFYNRQSTSLLLPVNVSYTTGFASYIDNFGGMRNRGVEVTLAGSPVKTRDFEWNLNFNIALNKNKLTNLVTDKQISSPFIRQVGQDYQSFYLPQYAGVNPDNGMPRWYTDATRTTTTEVYGQAQRVLLGKSAAPKAFGSFGTTLTYKGLSLDALFYYNFGNWIYNSYYQYQNSGGAYLGSYNQSATELARWQKPGDITDVPKMVYGNGTNSFAVSDRMLNRGDFVRLRDITLGYNLPKEWLTKAKLSSVRVYARGSNLFTWIKDKKLPYDPESTGTGGTNTFELFIPKTVTFGVNVGF